jgi:Concanavalin A-like lectin/glucanases superfamily
MRAELHGDHVHRRRAPGDQQRHDTTDIGATTNNWLGRSQFSGASGNDPCFNGYLDDFRVYRRALSQAEISAMFALR